MENMKREPLDETGTNEAPIPHTISKNLNFSILKKKMPISDTYGRCM